MAVPRKAKIRTGIRPCCTTPANTYGGNDFGTQQRQLTPMMTVAIVTVSETENQPKYLPTDEQIFKMYAYQNIES